MNDLVETLVEAFAEIENHDLKATVLICTVCGYVLLEKTKPCKHLLEMVENCDEWLKS